MPLHADVTFKHARYYQQLASEMDNRFHRGSESEAVSAQRTFEEYFPQIQLGQSRASRAMADDERCLSLCVDYTSAVFLLSRTLRLEQRIQWLMNAAQAAMRLGHYDSVCSASFQIGLAYEVNGYYAAARDTYDNAIGFATENGLRDWLVNFENALGDLASSELNYDEAKRHYEDALRSLPEGESSRERFECLVNLGNTELQLENFDAARTIFDAAYRISLELDDGVLQAKLLHRQGKLDVAAGEFERALDPLQRALSLLAAENRWRNRRDVLITLAGVYQQLGNYEQAQECCQEAIAVSRRIKDRFALIAHLLIMAHIDIAMSQFEDAAQALHEVGELLQDDENVRRAPDLALTWAKWHDRQGMHVTARKFLEIAQMGYQQTGLSEMLAFVRTLRTEEPSLPHEPD